MNMDPPTDEEEGKTPLIEAVAINGSDAPPTKAKKSTIGTDDPDCRRVFQVVAPADLRKGYRLNVFVERTQEEVVVLIPPGGVKRSETFQGKEARPLTGEWSDDVFDCSPNYEGSFCQVAFCVAPVGWGILMEKLGCCDPALAKLMPWFMGALTVLYLIVATGTFDGTGFDDAAIPCMAIIFLFVATATRSAVRRKYNIPGNCIGDCFCVYCCNCCTLLQAYRHMKRNGDTPLQGSSCGGGKHTSVRAIQV